MRALLVFLLFCGFAFFARWYYVCQVKQLCGENQPADTDIRLRNLSLREGEKEILKGYDQFAFDSASVAPRLNENNREFLDSVAGYLQGYPEKNLTITALYRRSEENIKPGFYENIGNARGNEIRKLLIQRGIAEERVTLDYGISDDSLLQEPLAFELYSPSDGEPEEFEKTAATFTNMTFSDANFKFDSDEFRPGEPFLFYADSVKTFLELNKEKKLVIIGHTDNIGKTWYNQNLGLRRAKSARDYFRDLGVTAAIEVNSEGEKRPVASNRTSTGRQKNRRVNFVIE